jgi:putative hydrolase of the HAD superfamily
MPNAEWATRVTHLLLDFFGTLVAYSESRVTQGFRGSYKVLRAAGAPVGYPEFLRHWDATFAGFEHRAEQDLREYSMDAVCAVFLHHMLGRTPDPELLARFRDTYLREWNRGVQYLPGVPEALAHLAERFTLVLVTNTHHADLVHGHLRAMGADRCFAVVVTSVEHGKRKPSRCIFDRALTRSGGTAAAAVYIGDSFSCDYRGATAAGLRCLLIDPDRRHDVPEGDRLSHVLEAPARLGWPRPRTR